jgi:hypothetical protein
MPRLRRRASYLAALCLVAAALTAAPASPAAAATTITINGTAPGRTFDGVGAISVTFSGVHGAPEQSFPNPP